MLLGILHNKLKSKGLLASSVFTYDFSTFYTTLTHNLVKEKLTELIKHTFNREGSLYLACNEKRAFLRLNNLKDLNCGHVRKFVTISIIIAYLLILLHATFHTPLTAITPNNANTFFSITHSARAYLRNRSYANGLPYINSNI